MNEGQTTKSTEERDQFQRSVKKYKRPAVDEPQSYHGDSMPAPKVWADLVREPISIPANMLMEGDLYTGEGEADECDEDFHGMVQSENEEGPGKVVVEISAEECKRLWRPWSRALVVKLLGRSISFRVLSQRLTDIWSLNYRIDIIDLEDGYYVIRFYSKEDYTHVLEGGPWTIQGHYLTVSKFKPGFHPSTANISSTMVWIRIPRLPLEFFHESVLMRIGDQLGTAVKIDSNTSMVSRGKYARICVEIDLQKPLVSMVILNGHHFKVEYENLHLICFNCGKYGHAVESCQIGSNVAAVGPTPPPTKHVIAESSNDPFGPWMIARNNNRRRGTNLPRSTYAVNSLPERTEQDSFRQPNVGVKQKGSSGIMGSRFAPIFEDEEEIPPNNFGDTLGEAFAKIQDSGPPSLFRSTSKSQLGKMNQRKSKGVLVKDTSKVKVQIPRPSTSGSSTSTPQKQTTVERAGRNIHRSGSISILPRPLADITNSQMQDTAVPDVEVWQPIPVTSVERSADLAFVDQTKEHPPDSSFDHQTKHQQSTMAIDLEHPNNTGQFALEINVGSDLDSMEVRDNNFDVVLS